MKPYTGIPLVESDLPPGVAAVFVADGEVLGLIATGDVPSCAECTHPKPPIDNYDGVGMVCPDCGLTVGERAADGRVILWGRS